MNATMSNVDSLLIGGNAIPYLTGSGAIRGEIHG